MLRYCFHDTRSRAYSFNWSDYTDDNNRNVTPDYGQIQTNTYRYIENKLVLNLHHPFVVASLQPTVRCYPASFHDRLRIEISGVFSTANDILRCKISGYFDVVGLTVVGAAAVAAVAEGGAVDWPFVWQHQASFVDDA